MNRTRFQWIGVVLLLAAAGWRVWLAMRPDPGTGEKAYFYDLSRRELFVAARGLIPPIRGIDDAVEDGVRAVVVAPAGKCDDPKSRRIAYLETNAPELKKALEDAKAAGTSPAIGRAQAQSLRLVRRPTDADWVSLESAEGERIVAEWAVPGPDGASPQVCSP